MRVLLTASAVGAIGDGLTGGVTDMLHTTVNALVQRGHEVHILASKDSLYEGPGHFIGIDGRFQPTIIAGAGGRDIYPVIPDSLISHYWQYAFSCRRQYDVILNLCQDWLPYYLTSFFDMPVLHIANICDENAVVSEQLRITAHKFPARVAVMSHAQAAALGIEGKVFKCTLGIDVARYPFRKSPETGKLIWCARISPEKGLEDAAEIARRSGRQLLVCGYMQDAGYFTHIQEQYPDVIDHKGFLDKMALAEQLGRAEALLCTHKWLEAFGLAVIESLACGTPVVTYDRGGPAEIIHHGKTGFIIPPDDMAAAAECLKRLPSIRRDQCRLACEKHYSLHAYGDRIDGWLKSVVID
jgi:UDP-glucose:tetrahydrobiopterin glucosyltransferase